MLQKTLYDKIKKLCLDDRIISGKCPQKSNRYAQAEAKALNKRRTLVLFFLAIGRKLISN